MGCLLAACLARRGRVAHAAKKSVPLHALGESRLLLRICFVAPRVGPKALPATAVMARSEGGRAILSTNVARRTPAVDLGSESRSASTACRSTGKFRATGAACIMVPPCESVRSYIRWPTPATLIKGAGAAE